MTSVILREIWEASSALQILAEQPLKASISFRLGIILVELKKHLLVLEQTRVSTVNRLKDDSGNLSKEAEVQFTREMNELLNTTVIEISDTFSIQDFNDVVISTNDIMLLKFLISEDWKD